MLKSLSTQFVEKVCSEIKKPKYLSQIQFNIIEPLIHFIYVQLTPMYVLTLLLLIINIILNVTTCYLCFNMRS